MIRIITHDRAVHADDAFAAAILSIIYGDNLEVIRTRSPAILKGEAGQPGTFFLDVGGRYDPALRLFDHHQPEGAGFRPKLSDDNVIDWPYATAGLVWLHYGAQAVRTRHPMLSDDEVSEVVAYIDEVVLKYIDAVDCGVRGLKMSGPSLSSVIASFNSSWFEQETEAFPLVMSLAQVILTNFIKRYAGIVMARNKVRAATAVEDGKVLVLDQSLPWSDVVAQEMPDVLVVLYPIQSQATAPQWQLRVAVNQLRSPRMKLPVTWGGLEREVLAAVSGVSDAVFCHRSLHLAGAMTYDGALRMAQLAIQRVTEEQAELARQQALDIAQNDAVIDDPLLQDEVVLAEAA